MLGLAALALLAVTAGCGAGPGTSGGGHVGSAGTPAATGSAFEGQPVGHPYPKPAVTLTDTAGKPYNIAARTTGRVVLVYYGFTHCSVCRPVMSNLAQALREVPASVRHRTSVLFVTTDPARDSPAALRRWLGKFDKQFVGLTGSTTKLATAYRAVGLSKLAKSGGDDVVHGADVYAYSPDGKAQVTYGPAATANAIAGDLRLLAAGRKPPPPDLAKLEASGADGSIGAVRVTIAFIAQPAGGTRPIIQMTLSNTAGRPDTLIDARTSAGGTVRVVGRTGRPQRRIRLPAAPNGIRTLSASGTRLTITGRGSAAAPLRKSQLITLILTFAHAGSGSILVPVVGPAGPGS